MNLKETMIVKDGSLSLQQVDNFMTKKSLAPSSQSAYYYDLKQFIACVSKKVNEDTLSIYQSLLQPLARSARQRKRSTVNQFLLYLYDCGELNRYYHLPAEKTHHSLQAKPVLQKEDLTFLYQPQENDAGYLIALLIVDLGLLPSEIRLLKTEDILLDVGVMMVTKRNQKRVLRLSQHLKTILPAYLQASYLFDHQQAPYTRQWLFLQLNSYLKRVQKNHLSAKQLREQFILQAIEDGKSLLHIAEHLGLKTTQTLERYLTDGNKN